MSDLRTYAWACPTEDRKRHAAKKRRRGQAQDIEERCDEMLYWFVGYFGAEDPCDGIDCEWCDPEGAERARIHGPERLLVYASHGRAAVMFRLGCSRGLRTGAQRLTYRLEDVPRANAMNGEEPLHRNFEQGRLGADETDR